MDRPNDRLRAALPTVNLVTLVAAVAVLWWRAQSLEDQVAGLRVAVGALQVEVAVLSRAVQDKP